MKILILGGYGVFGGRLAHLLSDCEDVTLLIAGRTLEKAQEFCAAYRGTATVHPLGLDRKDIATALINHKPDMVVDASGPFQVYGADPYLVPKACLAARVDYLDLADGADFVCGITALDELAKAAGVSILSGVSTCPTLTSAVLRELGKDMTITDVKAGIAPSPHARLGLSVMKAVLSYAGEPLQLTRDGRKQSVKGLTETLRYTIAPLGKLPLFNRHFSLVDVPDLQLLPLNYPNLKNIWFGAGPTPEILHKALNLFARLRAILPVPSFVPLAPLFYRILNLFAFGEHRSGMFVEATGKQGNEIITKSWHLLAEGDDGPNIPAMAAEALIRQKQAGKTLPKGARPATDVLTLDDYAKLFAKHDICMGFRDDTPQPTFEALLGDMIETLPPMIKRLHRSGEPIWEGEATVKTGRNPLAKLVSLFAGINIKAGDMPVRVTFTETNEGQIWQRQFGDRSFKSVFALGTGRNTHLATERFGLVKVGLALVVDGDRLLYIPRRATVLGLPLPGFMVPKGESFESEKDGRFHFNVTLRLPVIGLLASYKGWLEPAS